MLFDIDTTGRVTAIRFFADELAKKLGYTQADFMDRNITDFLVDARSVAGAEHFGKLYATKKAFRAISRKFMTKSQEVMTAESCIIPLYDAAGDLIGHRVMEFFKK